MTQPVDLRLIDHSNRATVEGLAVAPSQRGFVDGVRDSLVEAEESSALHPWTRAVYAGDVPIGFLMIADDVPRHLTAIPWRYYLWRMLIDRRYQGHGHGRAALNLLCDYLRTRPRADWLYTSVVPGPGSPLGFYRAYGFHETGEWFDHEQILRLRL
jgi:diamine N-acetyltransferase